MRWTRRDVPLPKKLASVTRALAGQPVSLPHTWGASWSTDGPHKAQVSDVLPGVTVKVIGEPPTGMS